MANSRNGGAGKRPCRSLFCADLCRTKAFGEHAAVHSVIVTVPVLIALAGILAVTVLAVQANAAQRNARRTLLDNCAGLLDQSVIQHGGDDYPRLDGLHSGLRIQAELISDNMTIRRLPQLWLSITRIEPCNGLPEFGVLVRPAGTEFYALTPNMARRLDRPQGWPEEVMVRGSGPASQNLLTGASPTVGRILADGKVKEIAVSASGLRIVWQASEGRRGEYLLLRQATFDDASVSADDFRTRLSELNDLSRAIDASWKGPQT